MGRILVLRAPSRVFDVWWGYQPNKKPYRSTIGFWTVMIPVYMGKETDTPSSAFLTAANYGVTYGGWGLYNINELDKGSYTYNEVFKRNITAAAMVSVSLLVNRWMIERDVYKQNTSLQITPLSDGAIMSLSSNF